MARERRRLQPTRDVVRQAEEEDASRRLRRRPPCRRGDAPATGEPRRGKGVGGPGLPASMAQMITVNDDVRASARGLEEPLACYLTFNDAEHNPAIVAAFRATAL
uniref:OVATE domain-containing protein n=1 Tax=Aegilops tauschii TaxID=37682 RepID=M8B6T2_AEGTA